MIVHSNHAPCKETATIRTISTAEVSATRLRDPLDRQLEGTAGVFWKPLLITQGHT